MAWSSCLPSPRRRLSSRMPKCSIVATFAPFSDTIRQQAVPTGASPTIHVAQQSKQSDAVMCTRASVIDRQQRTKCHEMPVLLLNGQVKRQAGEDPRPQQPREHLQASIVSQRLGRDLSSGRSVVALDGERVGRWRQLLTHRDAHPVSQMQATTGQLFQNRSTHHAHALERPAPRNVAADVAFHFLSPPRFLRLARSHDLQASRP